jgi:FtsP/CotA-like multicopper oxidase with cupredoxin domain
MEATGTYWKTLVLLALVARPSLIAACGASADSTGQTRTYYVAADEVIWDYAPGGVNRITGLPFGDAESLWVASGPHQVGKVFKKALYREYTDATFTNLKPRPKQWEHLGLLGPLLRAEVGDTIQVVFRNNLHIPASMHAHGVFYKKDSEGAVYHDGSSNGNNQAVPPGATRTYTWPVTERAGPGPEDMGSVLWMYHSHVNEIADVNAGLVGPIIITARGMSKLDGTPKGVDREFVIAFATILESESPFIHENIQTYAADAKTVQLIASPNGARGIRTGNPALPLDPLIKETINGFLYGNTPGLTMNVGDHVRWYLMATTNLELHAPHWHGNTVMIQHMRTDVATLLTMGMLTADMVPDNPGTWLFHCHVGGHLRAGMQALYTVETTGLSKAPQVGR